MGELDLSIYRDRLKEYKLKYNYKAIDYMVNKTGNSLLQLRACLIKNKKTKQYSEDVLGATLELVKIGLYGSGVVEKDLGKRAYEVVENWRRDMGHIGILHALIIERMEKEHFFMGTGDRKILISLSTKKVAPEVVANIMERELMAMKAQAEVLKKL